MTVKDTEHINIFLAIFISLLEDMLECVPYLLLYQIPYVRSCAEALVPLGVGLCAESGAGV